MADAKKPEFVDPATGEACTHGVTFDGEAAKGLSPDEIRKRWPRGWGLCKLGCGFSGIAYASFLHYVSGDW